MTSNSHSKEWTDLVAAEREAARHRSTLHNTPQRAELLANAISSSSVWDRTIALSFMRDFPDDTPQMLEQLVDLALSTGWARGAIDAIRAAMPVVEAGRLTEIVTSFLTDGDAEDYLRLADLTAQVGAWQALGEVITAAASSDDVEKQEVARDFKESYGAIVPTN